MPPRPLPTTIALAAALLIGVAAPTQAAAQALTAGVEWGSLTPGEQQALAPLRSQWPRLDPQRQRKWLDVARRFPALPDDERARVHARMSQWSGLTPAERGQARVQFQEAQRWSPQARSDRSAEYQSLAPEARKVLAERWRLENAARLAAEAPGDGTKRNLIEPVAPPVPPRRAASPTSVQAPAGATSTLISPRPPMRGALNAGVPKIAATDAFVDPVTLLPRRGPQAAAVVPVPRSGRDPK